MNDAPGRDPLTGWITALGPGEDRLEIFVDDNDADEDAGFLYFDHFVEVYFAPAGRPRRTGRSRLVDP